MGDQRHSPTSAGVVSSGDGAVFRDNYIAGRDLHINVTTGLAKTLYRSCINSCDVFRRMGNHIASLRAILEVSEENVQNSSPENATRFTTILAGCNEVLQDLQGLFDEYEKLPVASQVTWERMEWRAADLADLKARLDTNVGLLDAFNSSISLSSQRHVNVLLQKFMDDVRNGRRPEGSIMSGKTVDSLLPDEREAWRQLRKELESAGITPDLFTVHQSFITRTLRDAVNAGAFEAISEECENTSSDIPSRNSFSTSSRPHSFSALAQNETVIEEESASSLLTERDEQDTQFIFQVSGRADQSPSRRDLEDLKEPNIHVSAAEPIEQGEHIIGERSRRDSSDTSLGSNSVPLLARPPSRIDKPVTSGAGGAAVKQDKDAVPNGASQDDKRASHNDPGSPGPSKSTRHPVLSLRLETKPKLKSARPGRTTKLLNVVFRRDKGLLRAAIHGDNDRVLSLLEKGVDIGSMDDNFCTALHHASENGHKDLVKVLLERGASIEQRDNFGHSALARASQGGHIEVVKLLLDKGASINTQNRRGRTPLLTEKAGLDPLLLAASRAGRTKEVDFLLWKGANIESVDHLSKDTPLIVACRLGHSETVKVLLQKQATMESIGNGGGTALIAASRVGNTEVLTLLLRCGANTEARDMFGRTALWNASCMVHVKAAEMLLQNGAEVTTRDNDGRTALMAVTRSSTLRWGDATRLVEILLERGSDVNEKDRQGRTGLMHAAENRDWAQSAGVIPVLLENGARINDQDNDGKTALDLARESGNRWAAEDLSNYTNEYIKPISNPTEKLNMEELGSLAF